MSDSKLRDRLKKVIGNFEERSFGNLVLEEIFPSPQTRRQVSGYVFSMTVMVLHMMVEDRRSWSHGGTAKLMVVMVLGMLSTMIILMIMMITTTTMMVVVMMKMVMKNTAAAVVFMMIRTWGGGWGDEDVHSFWPFIYRLLKSTTTQRRSRLQHGYCIGVSRRSAQATAGKGLAKVPTWWLERESNPRPSG